MQLNRSELHVWKVSLEIPERQLEQLRSVLCAEEISRSERFHFENDRRHFIAARGFLRVTVADYIGTTPSVVRFSYNEFGKPDLDGTGAMPDFKFNLSHSGGLALIAVAIARDVGVDIERIDESVSAGEVAEHFFSPAEIATLAALPPSQRIPGFFNCWTRKEAYIKARGMGLSIALDSFDVSLTPGASRDLIKTETPSGALVWKIEKLEVDQGFAAALAATGSDWKFVQIDRQPQVHPLDW
jgi:4'-phosphopantetheinyl transferase